MPLYPIGLMSERLLSRSQFIRLSALVSIATVLAACSREGENEKLERLNSPLREKLANSMGITLTTTPEKYAELCFQKATDPTFATDTSVIGDVVGLNGDQVEIEFGPEGGKSYTVDPDGTTYLTPNPLFTHEIVSAANPDNKIVFVGNLAARGRIKSKETELIPFLDGYLSGNKIPYTLFLLAAPGKTDLRQFGITLEKGLNGKPIIPDGVTINYRS